MRPEEFIRFAEELSRTSSVSGACCRSVISRAYYGAFLKVQGEIIRPMGIRRRAGGYEHIWLRRILSEANVAVASKIADKLKSLSGYSNAADYEINHLRSEELSHAQFCLTLANDIEKLLRQACEPSSFAQIQSGITAYLKKINEL